ncbi:hypothetical protein ACA910_019674 [Epithemia clementina (nom. ined.)]
MASSTSTPNISAGLKSAQPAAAATAAAEQAPTPQSRREKEIEATKKLLQNADQIVKDADESFLLSENKPREYPEFDRNEIKFGPVLGVGGFGIVFEVKDIILALPSEVEILEDADTDQLNNKNNSYSEHTAESLASPLSDEKKDVASATSNNLVTCVNAPVTSVDRHARLRSDASQTTTTTTYGDAEAPSPAKGNSTISRSTEMKIGHDDSHYDIKIARQHMAEHVRRNGEARYAVKRLHRDLSDLERARGMIDLAIEAKYLSVVWHPNIIKMRGIASGPKLSPDFFIIMDRLHETLAGKMEHWAHVQSEHQGTFFGIGANKPQVKQLLLERLTVAYDLAAAFSYMHDKKLVYRDIKQENIGFDCRGDVKVFDLGLCKGLSPSRKTRDSNGREIYGYNLTPRTGSVPYMAPEVAECKPYECKADVFSFAILLWEMLSLRTAFKGYSRKEFLERVVRRKERLIVSRYWPPLTRSMIKEAWDNDTQRRPDMKIVAMKLEGDLNAMTADLKVLDQVRVTRQMSSDSWRTRGEMSGSFRKGENQ